MRRLRSAGSCSISLALQKAHEAGNKFIRYVEMATASAWKKRIRLVKDLTSLNMPKNWIVLHNFFEKRQIPCSKAWYGTASLPKDQARSGQQPTSAKTRLGSLPDSRILHGQHVTVSSPMQWFLHQTEREVEHRRQAMP